MCVYIVLMLRRARPDTPGLLHHIMNRGIERSRRQLLCYLDNAIQNQSRPVVLDISKPSRKSDNSIKQQADLVELNSSAFQNQGDKI